jgi:ABC-type lipoprotein export system ATPase subunit
MNDPRGSVWRKWDLHVHTPASLIHQYPGADPWPAFLSDIEALPPEFKVIGINDYIFLDGYKRILQERAKGRLTNIDTFFPVIELRLNKFGGTAGALSRVNYHVLFSDEISPDVIEQQFLNALSQHYKLQPGADGIKWSGLPTKQGLTDLGNAVIASVPENQRAKFDSPLNEGFNHLCLTEEAVHKALGSTYFVGKYVTAVGKTEWADIKWNEQSVAEKKTTINNVDLVFTAAKSPDDWKKAKDSLKASGVNDLLLDCSDAHRLSSDEHKDRIGRCWTWIKADTTFAGLLQVLHEPDERLTVCDTPDEITTVEANPTKYISELSINRRVGASVAEVWFANRIQFNPGLVAIIGNKGKGKSAITDIIGLLGNTRQAGHFTFLSTESFRRPRDNKAKQFEATLTWRAGDPVKKSLDEDVVSERPELVKYIPQNFLEEICTQLGAIEESEFDRELKKVIFSHVETIRRYGKDTLDQLIAYKTSQAVQKRERLKSELHTINTKIVALEESLNPIRRGTIENLLSQKREELVLHDAAKPTALAAPTGSTTSTPEVATMNERITALQDSLATLGTEETMASAQRVQLAKALVEIDRINSRVETLEAQILAFRTEAAADFTSSRLNISDVLTVTIDKAPIVARRQEVAGELATLDAFFNTTLSTSIGARRAAAQSELRKLQNALDEPNRLYQENQNAIATWQSKRNAIIGDGKASDSIAVYEAQIAEIDAAPALLAAEENLRLDKAIEFHAVLNELADAYKELYAPVNNFIVTNPLAADRFQLNFQVEIVDTGLRPRFFEFIHQGVTGSFFGAEAGEKLLKELMEKCDFNDTAAVRSFLVALLKLLRNEQKTGASVRVADQLVKSKRQMVDSFYDLIFSLDYLQPRYALRMGDKDLTQLSPGERGTLLLVFYLLVDRNDIPLLIDQPEENLDNQTVYSLLVPCIREAKKRRQIFIVTHNPNLAVVCDADQVIHADLDKKANFTMVYRTGAIENPTINKAIVDVLEGTQPAFKKRESKYFLETP